MSSFESGEVPRSFELFDDAQSQGQKGIFDRIVKSKLVGALLEGLIVKDRKMRTEIAKTAIKDGVNAFLDGIKTDRYIEEEVPGGLRHIDIQRISPVELSVITAERGSMHETSPKWHWVRTSRLSVAPLKFMLEEADTNTLTDFSEDRFDPVRLIKQGIRFRDVYPDEGDPLCRSAGTFENQATIIINRIHTLTPDAESE